MTSPTSIMLAHILGPKSRLAVSRAVLAGYSPVTGAVRCKGDHVAPGSVFDSTENTSDEKSLPTEESLDLGAETTSTVVSEAQRRADSFKGLRSITALNSTKTQRSTPNNLLPSVGTVSGVYEAHELSLKNIMRRKPNKPLPDTFAEKGIDPLSLWVQPGSLSQYVSSNGRILPGYLTGLKPRNQKRMAKAVRRARAAGLISSVHQDVGSMQSDLSG